MNRGDTKQRFLHKAEISILESLRRMAQARFTDLMRPTGLTSDSFKFYVRSLMKAGWIVKTADGHYVLTPTGKELANNLDETRQTVQKQPKVSVLIVASRSSDGGETEYLLQQRLRHPYYGFWGFLSGPVRWGEGLEQTAEAELHKQTGLTANCEVVAFYRSADRTMEGKFLEDKLFAVLTPRNLQGVIDTAWTGGRSVWMTMSELIAQPKFFPLTREVIASLESGRLYASFAPRYEATDY